MDDMNETLMESLTGFDAVWQRVTARTELPDRSEDRQEQRTQQDTLTILIREQTRAIAVTTALARMSQGDGRTTLLRHAAEEKCRLRRLRAEYYILTGLTASGSSDCRAVQGRLPLLRDAFLQAGDLARRYEDARSQADSPELADAFAAFAAQERRRAGELRTLLTESF